MFLFCPSCGKKFEIPGHMEASAGHRCPECGSEFGAHEARRKTASRGRLRFVQGGETAADLAPGRRTSPRRTTPLPIGEKPVRKVDPARCELQLEWSSQGAGVIYQSDDPDTGEDILVRSLMPEGSSVDDSHRWAACATKLQRLRHPRIVPVLGVGLCEGSPHVAVERARGDDLSEVVRERPIKTQKAVGYALQIVEALSAAHGAGAVHGDLKPSNVMVNRQGAVRVMDFGYAPRALEGGQAVATPHVRGWLPFAAPELVREGPERADERSDSYSLGALVYYMLTGSPPFAGESTAALVAAVLHETPPPPSSLNRRIPSRISDLVVSTLHKDPAKRPANVQAMALSLQRIQQEGLASRTRRFLGLGRRTKRRRLPKVLLLLVALAGIAYGGYLYVTGARTEADLERARSLAEKARGIKREGRSGREAIGMYREAARLAAKTSEEAGYLVELARALLAAGDPSGGVEAADAAGAAEAAEAEECLRRAGGMKSPDALEASALLPAALASAGRAKEAVLELDGLARLENASRVVGVVVKAGIEASDRLVGAGKAAEAVEFLSALADFPERFGKGFGLARRADARAALGDAYAALGKTDEARKQYGLVLLPSPAQGTPATGGEAKDASPAPAGAAARAAEGLEVLARPGRARGVKLTEKEAESLRASPMALARYARTLLAFGRVEKSGKFASLAAEASKASPGGPARSWALLALGEVEEASGELAEALRQFKEVKKAKVADDAYGAVGALASVGEARVKLRREQARPALDDFQKAARAFASEPAASEAVAAALVGEGDALRALDRPDDAALRYRKVVKLHARERVWYLKALCSLGEVQLETRARAKAQDTFEKLAAARDAGVLGLIAQTMIGEVSEGELLAEAFDRGPDLMARAYYCAGLKRELAERPDQANAFYARGIEAAKGTSWYRTLAKRRMRDK